MTLAHPEGRGLWRFTRKDDTRAWADRPAHTAFEGFLPARAALGFVSFCEVVCELVPGPVRQDVPAVPAPSPEMVRRVRRNLRRQGVAL